MFGSTLNPFTPLSCKHQSQANSRMHFAITQFFVKRWCVQKVLKRCFLNSFFLPRFLEMCILGTVKSYYASSCLSSTSFTFFLQIFFPFLCHIWARRLSWTILKVYYLHRHFLHKLFIVLPTRIINTLEIGIHQCSFRHCQTHTLL